MTPADLTRIGEACFGTYWKTELARELGVSVATMRNLVGAWRSTTGPADKYRPRLAEIVRERADRLNAIAKKLQEGAETS